MKNYVPISDFATRQLNLRKSQKSQKFSKKTFFLSLKNAIVIKGGLLQCTFSASLLFGLQKIFFDLKWVIEMSLMTKWGPGGKI
jgi:hypothetical protein